MCGVLLYVLKFDLYIKYCVTSLRVSMWTDILKTDIFFCFFSGGRALTNCSCLACPRSLCTSVPATIRNNAIRTSTLFDDSLEHSSCRFTAHVKKDTKVASMKNNNKQGHNQLHACSNSCRVSRNSQNLPMKSAHYEIIIIIKIKIKIIHKKII